MTRTDSDTPGSQILSHAQSSAELAELVSHYLFHFLSHHDSLCIVVTEMQLNMLTFLKLSATGHVQFSFVSNFLKLQYTVEQDTLRPPTLGLATPWEAILIQSWKLKPKYGRTNCLTIIDLVLPFPDFDLTLMRY